MWKGTFRAWTLYTVLAVVVWGLFAADRGLLQDDAAVLFWVRYQARLGPLAALLFTVTPTRLLAPKRRHSVLRLRHSGQP